MMMSIAFEDLLDYTDWQRAQWRAQLQRLGPDALRVAAGPHGDNRFHTVADLVRHIFSAEKRYVERLTGRPLTDTAALALPDVNALFAFGDESRAALRDFIARPPREDVDAAREFTLMTWQVRATPRKVLLHVVMHEIRHWAQIATLLRLQGMAVPSGDLLFSPALGGEARQASVP